MGITAGCTILAVGAAHSQMTPPQTTDVREIGVAPNTGDHELFPGGQATVDVRTVNAFSQFSANMGFARELDFKIGNGIFRKQWVSAPSSTRSSSGLGPLFNARACQSCHLKDGRGHPPSGPSIDERSVSMLLRLSIPPETAEQETQLASGRANAIPEPTYGTQLQELGIQGHAAEGRMVVTYHDHRVRLGDGTTVLLRRPTYAVADLGYGPMHPKAMMSPRMAPQMIGLGLLEAVPEADILAREDPDDRDGDGIHGRANRVWSTAENRLVLGRFGWKAGQPSVLQQAAEAFAGDIGIGSWLVPHPYGDCMPVQTLCRNAPHAGSKGAPNEEIGRALLDLVAFYARNLGVPARRDASAAQVVAGKALFHGAGCAACHVPSQRTAEGSPDRHLRHQLIWPYTDLLLHDMGEGLADFRPEGRASGRQWRTAPLWGIGLTQVVNGHTFFLHDGRARNLTEAILWHGGEALQARDAFAAMSAEARAALLAFVNSL
jgi:CxxC motif-containing protein (DUF1111 family)